MKAGLYHPACRHGSGTYYPELAEVAQEIFGDQANEKAEVAHAENQVQKFKRLSAGCLEPQLKAKYDARLAEWEEILKSSQGRLTAAQGSGTIAKPLIKAAPVASPKAIQQRTGKSDVHTIGKIDLERFRVISPDITTDEVIITDERIAHIEEGHPGDFERFGKYIPEILDGYQYMLRDRYPNTALLLKQIPAEDGERVKLVLRLHVKGDNPAYKNSVISMWKIDEDRWETYSHSKKIIDMQE
jgi:hypothetical protein